MPGPGRRPGLTGQGVVSDFVRHRRFLQDEQSGAGSSCRPTFPAFSRDSAFRHVIGSAGDAVFGLRGRRRDNVKELFFVSF